MTLAGWSGKLKSRSRGNRLPPLLLLTDEKRLPDPAPVIAQLPRGSGVIFRHYGVEDRATLAGDLARQCRRQGLVFLVAGDAALAQSAGADGIHLPEYMLKRRLPPHNPRWIVTAAVHSLPAALVAQKLGVDAVLASPVFATASHPGAASFGPRRLANWTRQLSIPVYALGGVNEKTVRQLAATGIAGIAAIGGLTRGRV